MSLARVLISATLILVLAVAAAIAGWWFFIREDAELATEPPAIPEDLVDTTGTPPEGGGATTFVIIPEQSEAAYFVDEELASLGLPSTAKGATNAVQGTLYLAPDGDALSIDQQSIFTVDLTTLESNEERRDNRVQEALETTRYPTASFIATSSEGYDPAIPDGQEQTILLTGILEIHGVQREVVWEVEAVRQGNVITALATLPFAFSDFEITPPNIAGFVSVEDEGTLQVQLVAQAS
jgi:polyisoprenoid-binding protein YceI